MPARFRGFGAAWCPRLAVALFLAVVTFPLMPSASLAQAVQAALGTLDDVPSDGDAGAGRVAQLVSRRVIELTTLLDRTRKDTSALADSVRDRLLLAIRAGSTTLAQRGDPVAFRDSVVSLNARLESLRTVLGSRGGAVGFTPRDLDELSNVPVPQSGVISSDVAFSLGVGGDFGMSRNDVDVALATNLLGAIAGAPFQAVGADSLKEYLTKNVTVGTAFPARSLSRLTADLGVGLGGFTFRMGTHKPKDGPKVARRVSLWPVFGMRQLDAKDSRIPQDLRDAHPNEQSWSSPEFAIAVVLYDPETFAARMKNHQLVVIPTIGVRLPHFYPGDVFSATAAVFTDKRARFERSGTSRWTFGVWLPIPRVKPVP